MPHEGNIRKVNWASPHAALAVSCVPLIFGTLMSCFSQPMYILSGVWKKTVTNTLSHVMIFSVYCSVRWLFGKPARLSLHASDDVAFLIVQAKRGESWIRTRGVILLWMFRVCWPVTLSIIIRYTPDFNSNFWVGGNRSFSTSIPRLYICPSILTPWIVTCSACVWRTRRDVR